ncbi:MAG: pyrrolo-quinoline quinone [Candidatus Solibacter sp.]
MKTIVRIAAMTAGCALAWGGDWLTGGYDPQRTHWQRDEKILSPSTAKNMKLLWKIKLDTKPRVMSTLFMTLVASKVTTKDGPKQIALESGVSDDLFAIDVEKGTLLWTRHYKTEYVGPAPSQDPLCPGGQTAIPVIAPNGPGKYTVYAVGWDGYLRQINLADGEDIAPPSKFVPPNGKLWSLNLYKGVIYTHMSQHCGGTGNYAYSYDLATKKVGQWGDVGGGMWGRTGPAISPTTGAMYTGTGDGQWIPERGIFGNGIIGLKQDPETKALKLHDTFGPPNAAWLVKRDLDAQVTPVIFPYKGKELMVSGSKECRLWLMDTAAIGGDDHRTDLFTTPIFCNEEVNFASAGIWGSLATWLDSKGNRWVLSPFWGPKHSQFKFPIQNGETTDGGVAAFKVQEVNGKTQLVPAWISGDMNRGEPPIVANGVVYSFGSGENTAQAYFDIGLDDVASRRIPNSTHAVLYALDALTGKELWNSGKEITSFAHNGELSIANGRVYLGTFDGMLYCYGIAK